MNTSSGDACSCSPRCNATLASTEARHGMSAARRRGRQPVRWRGRPGSVAALAAPGATASLSLPDRQLPPGLPRHNLPKHIAVIMDGNSRWAKTRGMDISRGHEAGVGALKRTISACSDWGIPGLTTYAFSRENWLREAREVDFLLALFSRVLDAELEDLMRRNVRLQFIGSRHELSRELQACMARTEAATAANDGLLLTVALNYSGRADLAAAAQRIAALAAAGQLLPEQVTADLLQQHLSTAGLLAAVGPPDLLIRSSGERRLSNFMLFEAAYCELHFPDVMWPDFGERHLLAALQDYAARERRFGRH